MLLAGGPEANDPLDASTIGTGELIDRALEQGARQVVVGLGGSATTDGGLGALRGAAPTDRACARIDLQVACDVRTTFVDAAPCSHRRRARPRPRSRCSPPASKGSPSGTARSTASTSATLPGSGAAGGLAGGLAAIGGRLVPGFDLVAEHVALDERVAAADVVVTGEGYLDAQSLDGKVVGGVLALATAAGRPLVVIVGDADPDAIAQLDGDVTVVSLVERYGEARSFTEPRWCIEHAAAEALTR